MSDPTQTSSIDLAPITADYDIVGELGNDQSARILIATRKPDTVRRRDDDSRVHIEIVTKPEGDEAHALDHLASDVKTLSGLRHRRLVSVLEGRWLGADAFAVVRERVDDPSVSERLAQGETFTNTRTAAILREVHGLLEWARGQDIVHRVVTPDRIFLEPKSDRVRVSFAAGPIPRVRTSLPVTDDALAVVRLAVAMLAGNRDLNETREHSLAELRPDLPERLLEQTASLLENPTADIDVPSYLALIGMADPVAEGETERDRIRAEVLEEQRVEREKLASERADFEKDKAEERRALAAEGEELRRVFAEEKAKLEREFTDAQAALDAERARMQRILADERSALAMKQEELEREFAARVAAVERAAAVDRASIEELRNKIREAGEREVERKRAMALEEIDDAEIRLDTGELATPEFVRPYIASLDKITFRNNDPLAPEAVRPSPKLPETTRLTEVVDELKLPRRKPIQWRKWLVPGGIAAAVIIALTSTLLFARGAQRQPPPHRVTTSTAGALAKPATTPAAGAVGPAATPARPAPTYVMPSPAEAEAARQWLDSLRQASPVDMEWAVLQSEAAERRFARTRVVTDSARAARARVATDSTSSAGARAPRGEFNNDSAGIGTSAAARAARAARAKRAADSAQAAQIQDLIPGAPRIKITGSGDGNTPRDTTP